MKYDQAGDGNYNAATQLTESVAAQKANQTITVNPHAPASAAYDSKFIVGATSDGLSVFGGAATAADPSARGQALLQLTRVSDFVSREFPRAFVQIQYFGYLRRNPNDPPDNNFIGYQFWLNKLSAAGNNYIRSEMVKAFVTSNEYRARFGL